MSIVSCAVDAMRAVSDEELVKAYFDGLEEGKLGENVISITKDQDKCAQLLNALHAVRERLIKELDT